jgi:hypothetical protein
VNTETNHIVALDGQERTAYGLYVADARDSVGKSVTIATAKPRSISECPSKFYNAYRISEMFGPYESEWKYAEIDENSVVFSGEVPFRQIPLSQSEKRSILLDRVQVGSVWTDGKKQWCVKDKCMENLAGNSRMRVWITDPNGKRGQAIYATSLIEKYSPVTFQQ